jgi:flagellar L-ring protein precursor FlgH
MKVNQAMSISSRTLLLVLALPMLLAGGCTVLPPSPLTHSPDFAPVQPVSSDRTRLATGGIYNSRVSESWFGRGRNYQVGDVITVLLSESTQAKRSQDSKVSRDSSNDVIPKGVNAKTAGLVPGLLSGLKTDGGKISNTGTGTANQLATLEGSVAVTVVDVLANGNLVLRGEKQLALSEGSEVIQVAGTIRPEDVAPNNTVQSRRLANAQITYRGTGDLAAASRAGWGTSGLLKLWPF